MQYLIAPRIKISLVFLEVWNLHDMIPVRGRARETLTSFLQYRQDTMGVVVLDLSQLITSVHTPPVLCLHRVAIEGI